MLSRARRRRHLPLHALLPTPPRRRALRSLRAPESPPQTRDVFTLNSAITSCFRSGDVERARQLFDEMPHRNSVTWNCMVSGFVANRMISDARRVFDQMPAKNVVSSSALVAGYAKCGRVDEARDLFDRIPRKNVVCWNSMISGYALNGMIQKARELFDEMPLRNGVSFSIMISAYLRRRLVGEARALFDRAPSPSSSATSLCNALLSGYVELGRVSDAEELFGKMDRRDVISWNVMITCYARGGRMDLAERLFDEMPEKDTVSWTAVLHGYLLNRDVDSAWKLFNNMPDKDAVTWNTMMGGFVQNGMFEDALRLFHAMPEWERDIVSWNTILQGYVRKGDMANANYFFGRMPRRSETSWNTLISGYEGEEALVLLSKMVREGFKPDQATLSVVISVCASLVALNWGKMVHSYAVKSGYPRDALVMSSLISMYSKCGLTGDAHEVFEHVTKRDTITWNAMIATYAYHGLAKEAFALFGEMIERKFVPDHATFLSLLIACAHRGLVDEGCKYFESMQRDWKLVPRSEHYSCMVDLFGRSGFINQAHELTNEIPSDRRTTAWETLLNACKVHGNLELGEAAARKVLQDDQLDGGGMYILLSNIYAGKGMWGDAASIRSFMRERGVKKETGCSWIEIQGEMAFFSSNDKSHPLIEEICRELDNISNIIEEYI
ncbi:pentatricopeptide repeat-containing protein At4g02750-like [Ananas comosus]|uniref:Pentatricopeptide repeat-containing protein At4g02750-like n=1 Tax=Ananas comosus TaxID=4615 RepID=A0A6P5EDW2_ANACO|nr:pentatricopeptide repeat-containing protein At4g02750-like [Ananas comosus]XP_020081442.1 pentatricopeptide repeat-containing protein At4g02750-like [Ananas comosus]